MPRPRREEISLSRETESDDITSQSSVANKTHYDCFMDEESADARLFDSPWQGLAFFGRGFNILAR